ncbi:RraA family protein [Stutzerimonas sp. NM35]
MKVVAFVPAKGSSSRVENKNTKLLDGKPLFLHTLEKLISCDFIDEVYLDTESEDIISLAAHSGAKILRRDVSLASNATDGNKLFMNEVSHVEADIYIQVLGTSPFISPLKIKEGVDALRESDIFDSAVLVRREKQYAWDEQGPKYDINNIPNSVDLSDAIVETMGLYVVKRDAALRTGRRIGDKPYLINASVQDAFDVNYPDDFEMANLLAAGLRERDRRLLNNIKSFMTSPILSDILDDLGYCGQIISGLTPNISGGKLLGRAKTLKLRELRPGEDFKGIYSALRSYDTVVPNDIIMVENCMGEYAYFGELNANLALRAGAIGTIVGGKTRDGNEVLTLGYPVFSTGYTCQDVRRRATVDSINEPIQMSGVRVVVGDLVFADNEGVIVIPKKIESKVIEAVYNRAASEKKILNEIAMGVDVDVLTEKYGFF